MRGKTWGAAVALKGQTTVIGTPGWELEPDEFNKETWHSCGITLRKWWAHHLSLNLDGLTFCRIYVSRKSHEFQ